MVWSLVRDAKEAPPQGKKPKILIGILCEPKCYVEWAAKTLAPVMRSEDWCTKRVQFIRGMPIPVARDEVVCMALADPDTTHVMWIDSDVIYVKPSSDPQNPGWKAGDPNEAIKMLYDHNQQIVSGLYRTKQKDGFHYAMWKDLKKPQGELGFGSIEEWHGNWLEVDIIPGGWALVRREVYEKMSRPWYPWDTPKPGEDFNFSIRARRAGFKLYVDTDIKLRHLGDVGINPDGSFGVLEN